MFKPGVSWCYKAVLVADRGTAVGLAALTVAFRMLR